MAWTHTRTRRRFIASTTSLVGLAAVACGQTAGAPASLTAQKNAALEVWIHGESHAEWQKGALDDYNKEKGFSVTATWTKPADVLVDKLIVALAAGSGYPDMADIEVSHIGKVLRTAAPPLVALNEYLKAKENDFFKPSAFDPWSSNGKYYGIGSELNVCVMGYRYDLFDRAGIKAPLATWDDVVAAGKKVLGVAPKGIFLPRVRSDATGHPAMLAVQAGGGFFSKDNRLIVNDPNNARAVQYLADLINQHQAAKLYTSSADFATSFNTGQVAAELGPTWQVSGQLRKDAPDTNGKWMVQPFPQWAASGPKRTTSWGGTGITVLKDSKFKDLAVDFAVWEHTTKSILRDYDLRQTWPSYKKVYDDPRLNEAVPWFNNQKVGSVLRESAETMLPFYQGVWWPAISPVVGKHLTAALENKVPVRQALDLAQAEAKGAIEAAGGKVGADGKITGP